MSGGRYEPIGAALNWSGDRLERFEAAIVQNIAAAARLETLRIWVDTPSQSGSGWVVHSGASVWIVPGTITGSHVAKRDRMR